ncbi:hypothetical protein MG293_010919 [Ovis ammon polii]|uniref:Nuclear cap-binding protein subunit 2 n=1 Tax=Ovis ammon polii TaxID=230172 RepID=A0AAD4U2J3_OVIAM|nr:hypothetical protein MG293_010919 [Ovis ammon polii]
MWAARRGDLSFHTAEEQTYKLFSKSGDIKKIILGLDKMKKTACVFCFVGYDSRADAENTTRYINGTYLVDRSFSQTGMRALTRAGSLTVGVPGARNEAYSSSNTAPGTGNMKVTEVESLRIWESPFDWK